MEGFGRWILTWGDGHNHPDCNCGNWNSDIYGECTENCIHSISENECIEQCYGGDEDVYNFFQSIVRSDCYEYAMEISDERFDKCNDIHEFSDTHWEKLKHYGSYSGKHKFTRYNEPQPSKMSWLDNYSSDEQSIMKKLSNCRGKDKRVFGYKGTIEHKYVKELLRKQENKCIICEEEVLLSGWRPLCCYQFSIDRIDNKKPHNNENCFISCYYCNCRDFPEFTQHLKVCSSGCHTEPKNLRHRREFLETL